MSGDDVDGRKVGEFLALAFGLSWAVAAGLVLAGVEVGTLEWTISLLVGFMWAPAVAAIVVERRRGESVRAQCGLAVGRPGWVALAWVTPVALLAGTVAISTTFPGVSFTTDYGAFLLESGLSPEAAEEAIAELEAFPVPPVVLFVVQGLVVGLTINAVAALGEELGWRGLLLSELAPMGFWKLSILTGAVWGVWHAPIVLQGHNFPDAPVAGVVVMTGWTIAASPAYTYLAVRARSVLAATFLHGSFNGLAGLSLVYLDGSTLLTTPVGVAGIGAALVLTAACVVHDRLGADASITTGGPLSPWE